MNVVLETSGGPTDELHRFTKSSEPAWAKLLTRLPCLVVNVKFQIEYTTKGLRPDLKLHRLHVHFIIHSLVNVHIVVMPTSIENYSNAN